ncbi:MAG: hypothetical protein II128_07240, partial [Atopobiaceae bacterium]|nr:hypothetical protein [Atopobiaceae bacterium]
KTFEDVFTAIDSGKCKYGVIPIENSTAGSVTKVYDLMMRYNFNIVRSVRFCARRQNSVLSPFIRMSAAEPSWSTASLNKGGKTPCQMSPATCRAWSTLSMPSRVRAGAPVRMRPITWP